MRTRMCDLQARGLNRRVVPSIEFPREVETDVPRAAFLAAVLAVLVLEEPPPRATWASVLPSAFPKLSWKLCPPARLSKAKLIWVS